MNDRQREFALGLAVVILLVVGAGFDALGGIVENGTEAAPVEEDLFVERAQFCPPAMDEEMGAGLALAGVPGSAGRVKVEGEGLDLEDSRALVLRRDASTSPVGSGALVSGSSFQRSSGDLSAAGAARCSGVASDRWYFPEGSSAIDFEEHLIVYNPFPYEAVVRVDLYTPAGRLPRVNLADQAVPAGETRRFALNEFVRQQRFVGARVTAQRGRVVAWKTVDVRSEDRPPGRTFVLGATRLASDWFFPEGEVGTGADERISILNPTLEEAVVTVSISTSEETVQPPRLVEVTIPPETLRPIPLEDFVTGSRQDLGGSSVSVRSSSGAGVVAERVVFYDSRDVSGVAGEVGVTSPARGWIVGPPAGAPLTDAVVLMNPGQETATVSVVLLRVDGPPVELGRLTGVRLEGSTRVKLPIAEITRGKTFVAVVTSDRPIVAERVSSAAGDVSAVMGDRFEPEP